jgi:integrase
VPQHLVPVIGRTFIRRSLKTSDRAEAKKLRAIEDLKTDAIFDAAEREAAKAPGPDGSSEPVPMELLTAHVRRYVEEKDRRFADRLAMSPPEDPQELQAWREEAWNDLSVFTDPAKGQEEAVSRATDALLREAGLQVDDRATLARAAEFARRANVELLSRKLDRLENRFDRAFHDVLFDPERKPNIGFGAVAKTYLDERLQDYALNGVAEKRADQIAARVGYLRELIGDATAVQDIDDDIVQRIRELLARTPTNRTKHYPKLSALDAITRGEKDKGRILSPTTQAAYLDVLRGILKVAVRRRFISYNPAEDAKPLKRDQLSAEEKRLPWTPEQLIGFFTGSFYRSSKPGALKPYSKPDRDWRFWLPLLMLLTGARPGEICQLEVKDIRQTKAGTWYMDLRNEDGSKKLKTDTSRRRVPLHPELLRMGFLVLVEARRKAPDQGPRLFSSLKPNKYHDLAYYPLKRLRDHFIPQEITLGDRQSVYSLRHNVRDALRRIKAPSDALRHIAGWSQGKNVSDHYGDPGNPDLYAEYVAGIAYPGLDLSFLHVGEHAGVIAQVAKDATAVPVGISEVPDVAR